MGRVAAGVVGLVLLAGQFGLPAPVEAQEGEGLKGWIVFVTSRDGNFEIYKKKADGSERPIRLTRNKLSDTYPAWSPGGRRIAFVRNGNIYTMWADGSHKRRRTSISGYAGASKVAWSPDGGSLAYGLVEEDGGDLKLLHLRSGRTRGLVWQDENSTNEQPTWSPDGTEIAFVAIPNGWDSVGFVTDDVTDPRFVTAPVGENIRNPSWSPDGSWILFDGTDQDGGPDPLGTKLDRDLFVMSPDGSEGFRLEEEPSESMAGDWSPDSSHIVFYSGRNGSWDIFIMDVETRAVTPFVTHPAREMDPDWAIRRR